MMNQITDTGKRGNPLLTKSFRFAINIVNLYKKLISQQEFVLSKQMVRSGTSIGANIHEAQRAQSAADFTAKMYIALKEAQETEYWLMLLKETDYITEKAGKSLLDDCERQRKHQKEFSKKNIA